MFSYPRVEKILYVLSEGAILFDEFLAQNCIRSIGGMKFFLFLGVTTIFARNFFEYVDGQIPLPMPIPGVIPMPGLAPLMKAFNIRRPTVHKRNFHFADHSSPNSQEIRTDSFKAAGTAAKGRTFEKYFDDDIQEPRLASSEYDKSDLGSEGIPKYGWYGRQRNNGPIRS